MLTVTLIGDSELRARFNAMPSKVHDALLAKIYQLTLQLKAYIVGEKLSGQVLNRITGKLAGSIQSDVTDSGTTITGRVYASTASSPYNAAQEFGATIPDRYPVNAQALHFFIGGKEIFAKFARGFTLKERSYMRSSLADNKDRIIGGMQQAVNQAVKS